MPPCLSRGCLHGMRICASSLLKRSPPAAARGNPETHQPPQVTLCRWSQSVREHEHERRRCTLQSRPKYLLRVEVSEGAERCRSAVCDEETQDARPVSPQESTSLVRIHRLASRSTLNVHLARACMTKQHILVVNRATCHHVLGDEGLAVAWGVSRSLLRGEAPSREAEASRGGFARATLTISARTWHSVDSRD